MAEHSVRRALFQYAPLIHEDDAVAGDVDCDGVADAIDAALMLQFEAGLIESIS